MQYFVLGSSSAITWPNFILHLRYIYSRYDGRVILADPCTLQPSPVTVLELLCSFMGFLHLRYLCVCVWWSTTTSVNQCISSVFQVVHSVRKMFCVACFTEVHQDCGLILL